MLPTRAEDNNSTQSLSADKLVAHVEAVLCEFIADRPQSDNDLTATSRLDRLVAQQQEQARLAPGVIIVSLVPNACSRKSLCICGLLCSSAVKRMAYSASGEG